MSERAVAAATKPAKAVDPDRILVLGLPDFMRCDNKVISARYSALSFLPKAIMEQFRRFANVYFLVVGCIMAVGYYTSAFDSAISPWTTLGPLAVVVSFSLLVEGSADLKRHRNDAETNHALCTILTRAADLEQPLARRKKKNFKAERDMKIMGGRDTVVNVNKEFLVPASHPSSPEANSKTTTNTKNVKIAYQKVLRKDIRQGHFVLVKNREMVPADIVLLASSNDQGSAYIETSSIDGETNLKLRNSPNVPKNILKHLRDGTPLTSIEEEERAQAEEEDDDEDASVKIETIQDATKRLTRFSYLGHPASRSVLEHPNFKERMEQKAQEEKIRQNEERGFSLIACIKRTFRLTDAGSPGARFAEARRSDDQEADYRYIAALTTEPPNASVHTFGGRLTLPPFEPNGQPFEIPLDAENVLLRGAVIRNTEWVIGVAFFTGADSKLVKNSFETRSKFSQLDRLMNKTVVAILIVMMCCIAYLASMATFVNNQSFDELFYVGLGRNSQEPWPYLPNLPAPEWKPSVQNWLQYFLMYVTLLTNFVPLSLYVTVEMITFAMLWFIYVDLDIYDDTTDTRAMAKSTIVTDLGRIQYIFSDKTGTLTQNVMRFKRCSVDGLVFGAPIQKNRPEGHDESDDDEDDRSTFYPVRQLLVGQFRTPKSLGLEGLGSSGDPSSPRPSAGQMLTFNAEMFLRVLSLCHTVVVEKDIDKKDGISSASVSSATSKKSLTFFGNRRRTNTGDSGLGLSVVSEDHEMIEVSEGGSGLDFGNRMRATSVNSLPPGQTPENTKSADGAPYGYAYQAESPDEGALVSAASTLFGFQVVNRDSSGIRLKLTSSSHLLKPRVVNGLKSGKLTLKKLAAESAAEVDDSGEQAESSVMDSVLAREPMEETWTILAVNKFDSDRKRMSILLRSPDELGSIPILFCKGADSSMLLPGVCASSDLIDADMDRSHISETNEEHEQDTQEWEMAQVLGLQTHLGEFASEGLRTLVLGMRVLDEQECNNWLEEYKAAAGSMQNRSEKLTAAATAIERDLHIVGATAIEDKLQKNVPQTISTLAKAGIKLWVLTGDKRETAVEIGYSTAVLTPKMHLTEVPDNGKKHVATQMSMEFIRLIKMGKLAEYQKAALDDSGPRKWRQVFEDWLFDLGKFFRFVQRYLSESIAWLQNICGLKKRAARRREAIDVQLEAERRIRKPAEGRRKVRKRAEKIIEQWLETETGKARKRPGDYQSSDDDLSLASEETPGVFNRAQSARSMLQSLKSAGALSAPQLRANSLQQLTVHESGDDYEAIVDEDALSMESFRLDGTGPTGNFDKKRRTILERLFAIDRDVRKGRLTKHLSKAKLADVREHGKPKHDPAAMMSRDSPRALVIEGGALKHLLGDPVLEEILFAVASNCDAVIACRASPKQKAMLLNLVRQNIRPEPITLAIGDGANDVGMIQEAHVGVGISGKEGKQAVNASDFAIAQFRFLEDLILIHGRWNFFRLSTVVLFSFYKNAVMAGMLIAFAPKALYSGTPLFDEWLIAMLNFVAGLPIMVVGLFDRCLSKEYVRANPVVYMASRRNELITVRTLLRWVGLVFVHLFVLYYFTLPLLSFGGGMTSAFQGLMGDRIENPANPGNGEGSDLKSVGTVTFSCMIILLAYKVLYESKSLIHGKWPAFTCRKGVGEGFFSRVAYTWVTVGWLSLGFYLWAIVVYSQLGRMGPSQFSQFTLMTDHFLTTRTINYLILIFVPVIGIAIDVCGKLFSNMFYPTQTQIHMEIEAKQREEKKMQQVLRASSFRRVVRPSGDAEEP